MPSLHESSLLEVLSVHPVLLSKCLACNSELVEFPKTLVQDYVGMDLNDTGCINQPVDPSQLYYKEEKFTISIRKKTLPENLPQC